MCEISALQDVRLSWWQANVDPVETPQEEMKEPVTENESEQYPEDEIPEDEEEEDDEDEDEDPYEEDYKVEPLDSSMTPILDCNIYFSESPFCFW